MAATAKKPRPLLLILLAVIAIAGFGVTRTEAYRRWRLEHQSVEELKSAATTDQNDLLTWSIYAEKLLKAGSGPEAAEAYDHVIGHLSIEDRATNPVLLSKAAYAAARFGSDELAVSAVHRATSNALSQPYTLLAAGILSMRQQRFSEAQQYFNDAVRREPSNAEAWNRLGTSYLALEQPRLAEEPLRKAVQLNPKDAPSHADLGESLAQQSRFREALAEYAEAARLAPNSADYVSQQALASASAARTEDDYSAASTLLVTAMQHNPDDAQLTLNLAGLQMRFTHMEEARRTYETAVGKMPDNPDAWFNLSTVYTRLGDPDSAALARRHFQDLLDRQTAVVELTKQTLMHPGDAKLHAALSDAQKRAGNLQAAFKELQAAVQLAPNDPALRARLDLATRAMSGGPTPNGMRAN